MKKTIILSLATLSLAGCGGKKEVASTQVIPKGEERIEVYCSGPKYFTEKDFFRANSVGESPDQANSKRMALSNARLELAGQIEVKLKAVIDNYFSDINSSGKQEYTAKYEGLSREVINQSITGTKTICEELTKTATGKYKTYIAIELSNDALLNTLNKRLSADEELKVNYNYEKFKETFNKEMNALKDK
jgi:hypothetical protein